MVCFFSDFTHTLMAHTKHKFPQNSEGACGWGTLELPIKSLITWHYPLLRCDSHEDVSRDDIDIGDLQLQLGRGELAKKLPQKLKTLRTAARAS